MAMLSGVWSDAAFLVLLPFSLACIVTALILGVQRVLQAWDDEDRSS
jgi:hypothetical protein